MFRSRIANPPPRTVHRLDLSSGLRRWREETAKRSHQCADVFSFPPPCMLYTFNFATLYILDKGVLIYDT